jgi:3-oxoacyl-[acyl-carrier protein] reductase
VLVHYGRGAKEAEAAVAEIRSSGGRAETVSADLVAPDGPATLAAQVRRILGDRLDVLVANAGVSKSLTLEETTMEDFDDLFAVNVRAPFFLVPRRWASGESASTPSPPVSSRRTCRTHQDGERKERHARDQALKRLAQPSDVAGAIVFLASADARWVTGDTLRVDGDSKL